MGKSPELKAAKSGAKDADRHAIADPAKDAALWARSVTTKRVSDLFKTLDGLPGHWTQVQNEVSRGNKHFAKDGATSSTGKATAQFIAEAIEKAAKAAKFDFPQQVLKFPNDMGWLKISREKGKVVVKSRP